MRLIQIIRLKRRYEVLLGAITASYPLYRLTQTWDGLTGEGLWQIVGFLSGTAFTVIGSLLWIERRQNDYRRLHLGLTKGETLPSETKTDISWKIFAYLCGLLVFIGSVIGSIRTYEIGILGIG